MGFGFGLCFDRCFSIGGIVFAFLWNLLACLFVFDCCLAVCLGWLCFLRASARVLFTLYRLLGCFNCLLRVALRFMFLRIVVVCFGAL